MESLQHLRKALAVQAYRTSQTFGGHSLPFRSVTNIWFPEMATEPPYAAVMESNFTVSHQNFESYDPLEHLYLAGLTHVGSVGRRGICVSLLRCFDESAVTTRAKQPLRA